MPKVIEYDFEELWQQLSLEEEDLIPLAPKVPPFLDIARQVRNDAYREILPKLGDRRWRVVNLLREHVLLSCNQMARLTHGDKVTDKDNENFRARCTELKYMGGIVIHCRVRDPVTKKPNCVYRLPLVGETVMTKTKGKIPRAALIAIITKQNKENEKLKAKAELLDKRTENLRLWQAYGKRKNEQLGELKKQYQAQAKQLEELTRLHQAQVLRGSRVGPRVPKCS